MRLAKREKNKKWQVKYLVRKQHLLKQNQSKQVCNRHYKSCCTANQDDLGAYAYDVSFGVEK